MNSILSLYTGTPFTVTASATSLNAPGNSQVADQVKSQVAMPEGVGLGASWFDPMAFASVTAARFGNAGLNIFARPGSGQSRSGPVPQLDLAERWNSIPGRGIQCHQHAALQQPRGQRLEHDFE